MCLLIHIYICINKQNEMHDFTTLANSEFRIKADGKLIGAGTLYKLVGLNNANKAFRRALNSKTDKTTIKLRNSLKIEFYTK